MSLQWDVCFFCMQHLIHFVVSAYSFERRHMCVLLVFSAYSKHHSTETALLYIHDHLVNAIGAQQVSCLCLLDLSAAFDTIDLVCHPGLAFTAPS